MINPTIDLLETIESFSNETFKWKIYKILNNYFTYSKEISQEEIICLLVGQIPNSQLSKSKLIDKLIGYWPNKTLYNIISGKILPIDCDIFWQSSESKNILFNCLQLDLITNEEYNKYSKKIKEESLEELLKKNN